MRDLDYLKLLAKEYPTVKAASSEIINLMAIRGLPKGTEYFFSDLHGEYEAFVYLLRSASGIIREKIRETFGHIIPEDEQVELANLIYYPDRNLARLAENHDLSSCGDLQGRGIKIHPLQSQKKDAEGVCLRHRRIASCGL